MVHEIGNIIVLPSQILLVLKKVQGQNNLFPLNLPVAVMYDEILQEKDAISSIKCPSCSSNICNLAFVEHP